MVRVWKLPIDYTVEIGNSRYTRNAAASLALGYGDGMSRRFDRSSTYVAN
jgi:alanine racemase